MGILGAAIGAVGSIAGGVLGSGILGGGGGMSIPKVHLQEVSLGDPNQYFGQYTQQLASFPGVESFTNKVNQADMDQYTKLLNQLYPGATTQLGTLSNLASSYLQGNIPADVQSQIQRATAQQSLQGGYAGTGMATNLTARDFGQTSMQLQQQGVNMFGTGVGIAKGMIPGYISPGSLLFSPAQLMARSDQLNYYNTDIRNQQQILNAGYEQMAAAMAQQSQQRQQSGLGSMISGLFGSGSSPSGFSKMLGGGLSNLFGGGSNTNPYFNLNTADLMAQEQGFSSYAAGEAAGYI
jgi:hypothetical protein